MHSRPYSGLVSGICLLHRYPCKMCRQGLFYQLQKLPKCTAANEESGTTTCAASSCKTTQVHCCQLIGLDNHLSGRQLLLIVRHRQCDQGCRSHETLEGLQDANSIMVGVQMPLTPRLQIPLPRTKCFFPKSLTA